MNYHVNDWKVKVQASQTTPLVLKGELTLLCFCVVEPSTIMQSEISKWKYPIQSSFIYNRLQQHSKAQNKFDINENEDSRIYYDSGEEILRKKHQDFFKITSSSGPWCVLTLLFKCFLMIPVRWASVTFKLLELPPLCSRGISGAEKSFKMAR